MDTCDECLRKIKDEELRPSKYVPGKYCPECIEEINAAAAYQDANAESKDKANVQGKK